MKISSASQIIFLLICALVKEIVECLPTCPAGTYYTDDLSACAACPVRGRCDDQYYRAINRCKIACEKKTTPPPAPTIEVQEPTMAILATEKPTVKTKILATTSEEAESKKNVTFHRGAEVKSGFAANPDSTDPEDKTPSSNSELALAVCIAVLVTILVCVGAYVAYRKVKKLTSGNRKETTSSEKERLEICDEASTSSQNSSPETIERKRIEGIELPVPDTQQDNRICSEPEKMLTSTLLLQENED